MCFNKDDLARLKAEKAVGGIFLQIYDNNGDFSGFPSNTNIFGASLEQISKINKVVAVAGGSQKTTAIRGAARAGLIDVLVTNYTCAGTALELIIIAQNHCCRRVLWRTWGSGLLSLLSFFWCRGGLAVLQVKNYQRKISELKRLGILGIGAQKGRIGAGSIVILVVDEQGTIITCEEMRGRTVFARFKERSELKGLHIDEVRACQEQLQAKNKKKPKKKNSILSAIESVQKKLYNRRTELATI